MSPFCYLAYGLTIVSELPLPELMPALESPNFEAGIVVRFSRFSAPPTALKTPFADSPHSHIEGGKAFFTWPGVGHFRVHDGREIYIDAMPGVEESTLRAFLLGPVLAVALYQRGLLVLHASATAFQDSSGKWNAIGFLGNSGDGKSTMAAMLHSRGHQVLTDDIIAVPIMSLMNAVQVDQQNRFNGRAAVFPFINSGPAQLRLWPQSLAAIGEEAGSWPLLYPQQERRIRSVDKFDAGGVALRRLYVLETNSQVRSELLPAPRALMPLLRYCYFTGILSMREEAQQFRQCATLASQLPIYRLERPRDLKYLAEVADFLEKDQALLARNQN